VRSTSEYLKLRGFFFTPHRQTCQIWRKAVISEGLFWSCKTAGSQQSEGETLGKNIIVPAIIFVFLVGLLGYSLIFKPRNDRFDDSARRVLSK